MRKFEVDSQRDVEEGGNVERSKDEKLERGPLLLDQRNSTNSNSGFISKLRYVALGKFTVFSVHQFPHLQK